VKRTLFALVVALACTAAACNKDSSSTPAAPTAPTRTTDTHSGTVAVRSSDSYGVPVAQAGQVDVTLTVAGPPSTIVMGLSVGTLDASSNCVLVAGGTTNTPAGTSPQLSGIFTAGNICIQVRDIGNATAPVSYTVTVLHP
jgi:hypothetical protein